MKRFLSLLAAMLLLLSLPFCAFADLTLIEDIDEPEVQELIPMETPPFVTAPAPVSSLPDWYPADVNAFSFFSDPSADRVVDRADIFSDNQESLMRRRIAEISAQYGKDVVIYTDNSAYGMPQNMLAADYYDFNGYGIGTARDGLCLFICMDPLDRGWQTVATGGVMDVYTEPNANIMDNALYNYLASARYGEGVLDWLDSVEVLYRDGTLIKPPSFGQRVQAALGPSVLVGLAAGLISYLIARSKMKVVAQAVTARGNLLEDSVKIRSSDHLDHVATTRVYSPVERNEGGRGGGGSSFGGGFSGHSGASHSSSGGRF